VSSRRGLTGFDLDPVGLQRSSQQVVSSSRAPHE
jgi:hypothetical protein